MLHLLKQTGLPLVVLCLAAVAGCGEGVIDTEMAKGTVTYNGQPVAGASVMFSPETDGQGAPAYATTDENGNFVLQTLQGAPGAGTTAGVYKVTISKVDMIGTGREMRTPEGNMEEIKEPKEALPRKYKFQAETPLTATIVEGQENVFEFNLED